MIAAAQYGRHNEKRESFGHSLVCLKKWSIVRCCSFIYLSLDLYVCYLTLSSIYLLQGVDPWGKVVADAGGYPIEDDVSGNADNDVPDPPSIVTLEIDLEYVNSLRQRMPIETHRSNASF